MNLILSDPILWLILLLGIGLVGGRFYWLISRKRETWADIPHPNHQAGEDLFLDPVRGANLIEQNVEIAPISIEALKRLVPLSKLSDEELIVFASERGAAEFYASGSVVFNPGEAPEVAFFLLEGELTIDYGEEDQPLPVNSDSPLAKFALNRGKNYMAKAIAMTDVQILRISRRVLEKCQKKPDTSDQSPPDLTQLALSPELSQSGLFFVFCRNLQEGRLELPPLPSVAIKLRQALHEDIDFSRAAKIIQADPSVAIKLIQVANCPLYATTTKRVVTCQSAISRLGLKSVRNLILSLSMKGLFTAKDPSIRTLLQEVWRQSLNLSILSSILAAKTYHIDPDKALLGGLIVRIGAIPFLSFAQKFPDGYHDSNELRAALPLLEGPVGSYVLSKWEFAPEYIELPLIVEDWYHKGSNLLELSDVVRLAAWHSYIGTPKMSELPSIIELPSYTKLEDGSLTAEKSLCILQAAQEQIADIYQILI
jgi:HD-like signal output (HDOD) protein